jgi:hypothetical protein
MLTLTIFIVYLINYKIKNNELLKVYHFAF